MSNKYFITLGYCGPTDCCLCLTTPEGTKEYLIESLAWNLCSILATKAAGFANYPSHILEEPDKAICDYIFKMCDEDTRNVK